MQREYIGALGIGEKILKQQDLFDSLVMSGGPTSHQLYKYFRKASTTYSSTGLLSSSSTADDVAGGGSSHGGRKKKSSGASSLGVAGALKNGPSNSGRNEEKTTAPDEGSDDEGDNRMKPIVYQSLSAAAPVLLGDGSNITACLSLSGLTQLFDLTEGLEEVEDEGNEGKNDFLGSNFNKWCEIPLLTASTNSLPPGVAMTNQHSSGSSSSKKATSSAALVETARLSLVTVALPVSLLGGVEAENMLNSACLPISHREQSETTSRQKRGRSGSRTKEEKRKRSEDPLGFGGKSSSSVPPPRYDIPRWIQSDLCSKSHVRLPFHFSSGGQNRSGGAEAGGVIRGMRLLSPPTSGTEASLIGVQRQGGVDLITVNTPSLLERVPFCRRRLVQRQEVEEDDNSIAGPAGGGELFSNLSCVPDAKHFCCTGGASTSSRNLVFNRGGDELLVHDLNRIPSPIVASPSMLSEENGDFTTCCGIIPWGRGSSSDDSNGTVMSLWRKAPRSEARLYDLRSSTKKAAAILPLFGHHNLSAREDEDDDGDCYFPRTQQFDSMVQLRSGNGGATGGLLLVGSADGIVLADVRNATSSFSRNNSDKSAASSSSPKQSKKGKRITSSSSPSTIWLEQGLPVTSIHRNGTESSFITATVGGQVVIWDEEDIYHFSGGESTTTSTSTTTTGGAGEEETSSYYDSPSPLIDRALFIHSGHAGTVLSATDILPVSLSQKRGPCFFSSSTNSAAQVWMPQIRRK